ncbi:MMPL family transporter [Aquimarina aquimarini]|uniref:MMPL family transporter n=1 Tax=Aquimarina aquimarini TaxID=1191734 RepID=UPI000D54D6E9|nr:MMPL family transporter [Aquimarina aquimarini]
MDTFFIKVYQIIFSKKIWSSIAMLFLFSGLIFVATRIEFEEDITKLIPTNDKTSDAQKVLKTVNFADKIIVNIMLDSVGSVDDLTGYATSFIDSITKKSGTYIKNIQGKIDDDNVLTTLDFVYQNLPLFLDEQDYKTIHHKIQKDSIDAITNQNYKTLISPTGLVAKKTILKDPFGLSFIALKKLQQLNIGDQFTLYNGYLLTKDKKNILLFINPALESSETSENAKFVADLYDVNSQLNTTYQNKVKSEYYGATLMAVSNAQQIKTDIQITISIALTILLIILVLFYKKITIPIILFVPTLFGGLLAIALLFLIREKISAISLGIGSVLLGVTLDYSLHILTHIRSNNSISNLYKDISKPILMSSLTTACAFLCLLFLSSQALQDLGIFAATSVLGASFFALIFIPQVYRDTSKKKSKKTSIDTLASYNLHKNKWCIIGLAVVLLLSVFTYNNVFFNKDLAQLNYKSEILKDAETRLDHLLNIAKKSMYIATYGNNEQEALKINDHIYKKLSELKEQDEIIDFSSIGAFVHSKENQRQKINLWHQFWNTQTIQNTRTNLIESGEKLGFKHNAFHPFYTLLDKKFNPISVQDYTALTAFTLDDYISTKNDFTTVTSLIKVDQHNTEKIRNLFKDKQQTILIDRQHMNETFLGNLKNDFDTLIKYSLIVVLLILFIFYRSLSLTIVTSIPIFLTWLLTIGIMGLLGIEFNIFNIIISTFIFGLGIDYSIFITNGLLTEYRTGEKTLPTHKTSIILSLITTILGVGVLIFAKHPALYSISIVSIIGILSAVFVAFTIQPILFTLFIGSKTKRPITLRLLVHSTISFGYFGIGGLLLSICSVTLMKIIPISKKIKMKWFHTIVSKFMKSVLYSNPFVKKEIINPHNETFDKQAIIIANHTSFLDILTIGMLHPKMIFLVNDWVYNSPIFGKAIQMAGFYPVSSGIENGLDHLQDKIAQGYSLMAFPEGKRSNTNAIKRFHKGAFYLAEKFNLDIIPVLIHGNSEVLPKGTFIIKDGSITVKILDRITAKDPRFDDLYSKKTKQISTYFRKEFSELRKAIEQSDYFHKIILEEYRYKGNITYKDVYKDLETNKETYYRIINTIDKKNTVIHLSKDSGQLDFLVSLDAPNRKLISCIKNDALRTLVKNSYITNNHSKITITNTIQKALAEQAKTLIINLPDIDKNQLKSILEQKYDTIILLKEGIQYLKNIESEFYKNEHHSDNLIILKTINGTK